MSLEKGIVAGLKPVMELVVDLKKRVDGIELTPGPVGEKGEQGIPGQQGERGEQGIPGQQGERGEKGDSGQQGERGETGQQGEKGEQGVPGDRGEIGQQGEKGDRGVNGETGIGHDSPVWLRKTVYREGTVVQHYIGQVFKALTDTFGEPGVSEDWERVGAGGFRITGAYDAARKYLVGDLYTDEKLITWIVADTEGNAAKFIPAPRVDALQGGVVIGDDGKGYAITRYGNKLEFDFAPLLDAMTTVTAEAITGQVKALADERQQSFDKTKAMVKESEESMITLTLAAVESHTKAWIDEALNAVGVEDNAIPTRVYRGFWDTKTRYSKGDIVTETGGLFIALKETTADIFDVESWQLMLGKPKLSSGGGGGGGGGGGTTSRILADGSLDMLGFGVVNVADPRRGLVGLMDAVNKQTMQQAIAAGSLYQGTYKPAVGTPNIPFLANTAFTSPVGGAVVSSPNAAAPTLTTPGDILVWFNMKGKGLDNFAATLAAPLQFDVTFSNGTHKTYLLPAGNYADATAVQTALNLLTGTEAKFVTYVNGADFWVGVETPPQAYATSIVGQAGGGFPDYVPGPTSTVLNTYNWVVSTTDPNVPEYAPPGLPGIPAGTKLNNSDLLQFNSALKQFEIIRGGNLTQSFADQRYWQLNAGNMAWADQAYAKGAVVYGVRFNAWFVANQNIVAGSPEPGTTPAGALWRKINSTYGSTIFFGKGDYNPANTSAAANWGMPAGTYPSGQQPLNGDSYYDVTSGTEVQFAVTQNAPLYTLSGTIGNTGAGSRIGPILGNADMGAGWPGTRLPPTNLNNWYAVTLGAPQTPTTGVFAGVTIGTGDHLIGYSGDPDAANGGWFIVNGVASATGLPWNIATPHPQARPDTITPTVIWGYRRNFSLTVQAAVPANGSRILLLSNIPNTTGITHIEIANRRRTGNGAVYEFEVITETGVPSLLSPIAIQSVGSQFSDIQVAYVDATLGVCVWGIVSNKAGPVVAGGISDIASEIYSIIATTYDYDLGVLRTGDGTVWANTTASADSIKGQENYPSSDLRRLIRAQSGDPAASIPPGTVLGTQTPAPQLATTPGLKSRWDIRGDFTGMTGIACQYWECRLYKGAGGDAVNMANAVWFEISATKTNATTGATEHAEWSIKEALANGYINLLHTGYAIDTNTYAFAEFEFDTRDPNVAFYKIAVRYVSGGNYVKLEAAFSLAVGNYTQRLSFYPWYSASGTKAIPVVAFKE